MSTFQNMASHTDDPQEEVDTTVPLGLSLSLWYSDLPYSPSAYAVDVITPWSSFSSSSSSFVKLFLGQLPYTMNRHVVTRVISYLLQANVDESCVIIMNDVHNRRIRVGAGFVHLPSEYADQLQSFHGRVLLRDDHFVLGPNPGWIDALRQDRYASHGTRALVVEMSRTPTPSPNPQTYPQDEKNTTTGYDTDEHYYFSCVECSQYYSSTYYYYYYCNPSTDSDFKQEEVAPPIRGSSTSSSYRFNPYTEYKAGEEDIPQITRKKVVVMGV